MRPSDPAATLQTLVAAIPDNQLRSVLIGVLLDGLSLGANHGSPAPDRAQVDNPRPARTRRGWPKGKRRKPAPGNGATAINPKLAEQRQRAYAKRREKRAAARAAKAGTPKIGSATPKPPRGRPRLKPVPAKPASTAGNGAAPTRQDKATAAAAFWSHAELLSPTRPWHAVARELNVNIAVAQDCCRLGQMPPNINQAAAARFLELAPG